jgi:uncharacterized protein YcfJ
VRKMINLEKPALNELTHFGILGMKWGHRRSGPKGNTGRRMVGGLAGGAIGGIAIKGLAYATSKNIRTIAGIIDGGDHTGYKIAKTMSDLLSSPYTQTLIISGSAVVGSMLVEKASSKRERR